MRPDDVEFGRAWTRGSRGLVRVQRVRERGWVWLAPATPSFVRTSFNIQSQYATSAKLCGIPIIISIYLRRKGLTVQRFSRDGRGRKQVASTFPSPSSESATATESLRGEEKGIIQSFLNQDQEFHPIFSSLRLQKVLVLVHRQMASCCRSAALHGCSVSNKVSTTARSPWLQSTSFLPLSTPPRIKKNAARAVLMANPAPSIPKLDPFDPRFTDGSAYFNNNFINIEEKQQQQSSANETFTSENLDGWLRESIHEIVGNIGEAPFLMHVFSRSGRVKLEREAATAEMWSRIKKRWVGDNDDSCKSPDGIVLVQELKDDDDDEGDNDNSLWGLVVQGRGAAAACYILDTCRVRSSLGFCTHFCLMRAQCFGEPTEVQVRKTWLQQERRR